MREAERAGQQGRSHAEHAAGQGDETVAARGAVDDIEFSRTNQVLKFSNLHRCCVSLSLSLSLSPPPCLPPRGKAERAGCNMISLHKDVSGV